MSGRDADSDPWADDSGVGWIGEPEESSPHEPEEFDPDSLGPDIPSPPSRDEARNEEAVNLFVKLVVVFNAALLALSVGPMTGYFLDRWNLGLQIFAVGVLLFAYGTVRYYQFRKQRDHDDAGRSDRVN